MRCREFCGACCTAPSINTPYYGMPDGKPAGVACTHLDESMRCGLFGDERRPSLCDAFLPELAICGISREQAMVTLALLEIASLPTAERPVEPS